MRSKLDAIHLLALFEYPLMEEYGIDNILVPFCDELKELSKVNKIHTAILIQNTLYMQGHYFNIHGQQMWFQGALLAFIGDTPANNRSSISAIFHQNSISWCTFLNKSSGIMIAIHCLQPK